VKQIGVSIFSLVASLGVCWVAGYLGDLAYIGGYDGIAPEELAMEFWYGKCSEWTPTVELAFKTAIVIGLLGTVLSFGALLYFIFRRLIKHGRKVL
jgi:hypothetical protein